MPILVSGRNKEEMKNFSGKTLSIKRSDLLVIILFLVLPVFGKKIKFHSLPWLRGASRSGRSSPPYFGNALPARAFTA
jgi:hypothetical protein